MKIMFFSVRDDEKDFITQFSNKYNVEVQVCNDALTLENVCLCKDSYAVSIMTTFVDDKIVEKLHLYGVKYISTRTIGYDHIDIKSCEEVGIHVGNVSYSLSSVAEYTVLMTLSALRNIKLILERFSSQDFSLQSIRGTELKGLTVGIIGTGKIGQEVIKLLLGFSVRIIAYDVFKQDCLKGKVEYVSLDTLYKESDVISLHAPNTDETYHMINKETIHLMKDNVCIINTSRGSLINTNDLIEAIESHRVGSVALDVIENESHLYYKDYKFIAIKHRELALLRSFPNVFLTPHTAFFTNQAVSDMVEYSISSSKAMFNNQENPWLIM